jgi:hypothetical protein
MVQAVHPGIEQQDSRRVVEVGHHPAVWQQRRGLLGRAALVNRQRVGAALVEAKRVHAVHHDLARQLGRQAGQQFGVALLRHRGNHRGRLPGANVVFVDGVADAGSALRECLTAAGHHVQFVHADITTPDGWQTILERTTAA